MDKLFKPEYLFPRYWRFWLALGLARLVLCLPLKLQYGLGRHLGTLLYHLVEKRRHIADVNLRLCFPDMSDEERKARIKAVFQQHGIGIIETAMSWWAKPESLYARTRYIGTEYVEQARAQGRGVLMVSSHYTVLDLGIMLMCKIAPAHIFHRPNNNPLFNTWIDAGRMRFAAGLIANSDMRSIVRRLKEGEVVWFGPDQDQGMNASVMVPFFGVPAATVTSTSRMARITGAAVVPVSFHRLEDNSYEVEFYPPLENFPSDDAVEDALAVNRIQEQGIRKNLDQYMWVHRRFKSHEKGKNYLYQKTQ